MKRNSSKKRRLLKVFSDKMDALMAEIENMEDEAELLDAYQQLAYFKMVVTVWDFIMALHGEKEPPEHASVLKALKKPSIPAECWEISGGK